MGHEWDGGDLAHREELWREVARVLKPGAYLVAFAGTRTYHRLACAVEQAGFDVRDMIEWLYGSGFPKSHNDGDGHGTALKPSHEPMMLAQVPREGTYAANDAKYGTGYLNIDDARVPLPNGDDACASHTWSNSKDKSIFGFGGIDKNLAIDKGGRWPANVCHDGSDAVVDEFPYDKSKRTERTGPKGGCGGPVAFVKDPTYPGVWPADEGGSAARFFYCAKPSVGEKESGLDALPSTSEPLKGSLPSGSGGRIGQATRRNTHATIKPIELMRWLIRLVVPTNGVVIDPFLGSGTTAIAAVLEGRQWIGIERELSLIHI